MNLLMKNIILIFSFSVENSISLETYNGKCPHRSQIKNRATLICRSNPLENYSCLYGRNGSVELCADKADYAAPGQRYVIKDNPHPENCPIYKYQPYKLWSNRSSDCEFIKSECSEVGQIVCGIGTTITDLTCRCDHMKGYAFLTTPRNISLCEPTVEDCSCFLKMCDESTVLASDYTCKPSRYSYEHISCLTLPDKDDQQFNTTLLNFIVHTEERGGHFSYIKYPVGTIITSFILMIFLGVIYVVYNLLFTSLDTEEEFTNKIQRNYSKLKTLINEQTKKQLVTNGFLLEKEIDKLTEDEILRYIANNSKTILKRYRRRRLKYILQHNELIGEILKTDCKDLPKPSEYTTETNNISINVITVNKNKIIEDMDSRIALDFLEKNQCDIRHISRDQDRTQNLLCIIEILEKGPEKLLDDLLKVLQEDETMRDLCMRLQHSRTIFSVTLDNKDLAANLLQHHFDDVVKILKKDDLYELVIDDMSARDINFDIKYERSWNSSNKDSHLHVLIRMIIKKGRNAILNFVDVLHKNGHEEEAFKLLSDVPN